MGVSMDLSLETKEMNGHAVVAVSGEVDVFTAPKLREQLIDLVDQGSYNIVVDLSDVEFLDSTGLGVLVAGLKRVKTHEGTLKIVSTKDKILKIFRITGLTRIFPIYDSADEAVSDAGEGTTGS